LAGPAPLPLSRIIELTGRTRAAIPHFVMQTIIPRLWRFRATSFPAPELDHIRYVCMVDDRRARDILGHEHQHDIQETVQAVDDIT
ncbi:MAG TPA: NAD-dependent epimerase, partial [Sorangium sp.]|nr:NAD-dependent epimerase [Sorangium sp.]